jgi:RecG-like helicase
LRHLLRTLPKSCSQCCFRMSGSAHVLQAHGCGVCRRDVREADFARLMPQITEHLKEHADAGSAECAPADFLSQAILDDHKLMPWLDALDIVHSQLGKTVAAAERQAARRRMVFNETLLLSIMMLHHRADLLSMDGDAARKPVLCNKMVCSSGSYVL